VGGQHQLLTERRVGGNRGRSGHVRKTSPNRVSNPGPLTHVASCYTATIRLSAGAVFPADGRRNGGFLSAVVSGGDEVKCVTIKNPK
jgi:hypothetical protein